MRRVPATVVSAVHFAAAPGIVVGLVPWLLTRWRVLPADPAVRVIGGVVVVASAVVVVHGFVRFVVEGSGTPAPVAPTQRLVVGGLYRYVRNPMYLAVTAAIIGQALALGQPRLLWYAAAIAATVFGFVRLYEEPALRRQFGASYDEYRRTVPAWWPRRRPWRPAGR